MCVNRVFKMYFIIILTPSYKTLHTDQVLNSEIKVFLFKEQHGKRHGNQVHQKPAGFVNYYKTRFNEVCCFCFRLRKALCAPQLVFSLELQSISAGIT